MTRRVSPQPPLEEKHQDQEQANGNQMRLPLPLPEDQLMHQSSWKERESPSRQQSEAVEVADMPAVFGDPACRAAVIAWKLPIKVKTERMCIGLKPK